MSGRGRGKTVEFVDALRRSDRQLGIAAPSFEQSAQDLATTSQKPSSTKATETQNEADQSFEDALEQISNYETNMATNCSVSAFWREQPELWFIQTEALFEKHKVTDDTMKFNTVVGALDVRTIDDLQDVIRNPPANNTKYATLKETIIKRTTESPDNNLLKLLTNLELGDSKPSQLWRKMQSLADGKILEPASSGYGTPVSAIAPKRNLRTRNSRTS
ncbi:hypothetical protein TSAR_010579 [Trichomalopsis sarcophagae]|uniref:DUF7041 domain-containing protein n=1 Tax=Trichomalopsis sarcophagae TaxID=543379 RepID=A0A232ED78_9HYME|nr:hypothetical protein TSAR_010579 [Trichomalopsis sarcophagae]